MAENLIYNRLRWRSRRGMLELDLLLLPFFDEEYNNLTVERQSAYVKLLEQDDPDLHYWFSQKGMPQDADLLDIVRVILDRVQPD